MTRLELNGLNVAYEKFRLSDISFSCEGGEILALIGRNGAGKTTTIDSIMGLTNIQSGNIRYNGQVITKANEHIYKEKIGYVSATQEYYPDIHVSAFLRVISKFYRQWDASKAAHFLSLFNIDTSKKLSQLSSGMRVKLSLVIALSHSAEIYLLDEPTAGLDPIVREQVLEILERMARERDTCILFSSHITQDVKKIASRILFLVNGVLMLDADMETLDERFVKLYRDDSQLYLNQARQKGIAISDKYMLLEKKDVASVDLSLCKRAPILIEDVLIYLEGGVNDAPAG